MDTPFDDQGRDAEETRQFYEDFLGLELTGAFPTSVDPTGKPVDALHLFFRMAGGDYLSFYDVANEDHANRFDTLTPLDFHLGMKVATQGEMEEWMGRLEKANIQGIGPLDHDFVRSVYFKDPNGVMLEITYEVAEHESILDREQAHSKEALAGWTVKTQERKQQHHNPFSLTR
nr:VOC family protein [Sphingobium sp. AntQ-1]